jgi:8-oxo-dGTP pyrophosphatase MutT (NUDIX family)
MAHIHEKIDYTVEVFCVFKNKVLLRMHDKYGMWLSVGGHVELYEDPNEAAVREVKEEVSLDVVELTGSPKPPIKGDPIYRELIPPRYMNRHGIGVAGHEHISLVYFARVASDAVKTEKVSDVVRWCTLEEVEMNALGLKEDVQWYARTALQELAS